MATESEQSRIERVLALLFAVLMVTAVFAPAVGATVTSGNDAAQDAVDTSRDDTAQHDESLSSQTEDDLTSDNAAGDAATIDDAMSNATGTIEVIVRVEGFDVPAASTMSSDTVVDELKAHAEESQQPVVDYAESTEGVEVRNDYWLANALLLELDTEKVDVRELLTQPGVTDVHANYQVQTPEPVEGDNASSADYDTTYGLDQINATEVWNEYDTMGGGTSVAVLDTGVDPDHPDIQLEEENWAEFNNNGNEVDSEPYDSAEHGTHTSGTVSGGNASGEYIGVAPEVELMHGKVLDGGTGSIAAILAGMEWAVEENADVMSLSLGASGEYIPDFIEPIRNAEDAGTFFVASSGNSGDGTSGSPGNVYESFAVGASDVTGDIASFSSGKVVDTEMEWGSSAPSDWPSEYVVPDVAAPGVNVKSSVPGGGYDNTFSGTSMAAPHVAGAVALMLSAADDPSADTIKSALEETAWKPSGEPTEPDTRYGNGIIDAKLATDRIAAESGVTGTVLDADGNPVEGATVSLDGGYSVVTDADGQYTLRGQEETFDISVSAFGYEDESVSVDVPNGSFVTEDISLTDELAAEVLNGQSDTVRSGTNVSTTVDTANVEQLTVELTGDYPQEETSLFVDGESVNFGETYQLGGSDRAEVTVSVETTAGVTGNVSLKHTYEGLNSAETISTGPTAVFNEEIDVGVVDTPGAEYNAVLANDLEDALPGKYNISLVSTDELMDVVDEYDTFVVQKFGEDYQLTREFVDATEGSDTGVVYLSQYDERREWSASIYELSKATGNPDRTGQYFGSTSSPVVYTPTADHQILDGVGESGEPIELYSVATGDHAWFSGYNGQVIADVGWKSQEMSGHGLAADGLSRSVYAASLGRTLLIGNFYDYTDQANQILANSVEYASSDSPVSVRSDQPEQASPGEPVPVEFNVTDLQKIEVGLDEQQSTLTEDDLKLYVNGKVAAFDQALAYDDVTSENFTVTVEPKTDAVGSVALEHELVADGEQVSGNTGPTAMYESPLEVPEDVDSIQEAVNLATSDEEIVLANGTYTEQVTIDADGKRNLTIRSAEGADATIRAPEDIATKSTPVTTGIRPTVMVHHNENVTLRDLTIDAGGNNEGILSTDAHNLTVADVTVTNARQGVRASYVAEDTHVKNVTVTDSDTGIMVYWLSDGSVVENSTVTNATVGIQAGYMSDDSDVVDSDVTDAETGIVVNADGGDISGNTVTDTNTAIDVRLSGSPARIEDNEIVNATVGIPMRQKLSLGDVDVTRNTVDAETAIRLHGGVTQPQIVYNDFSDSGEVFDVPTHTPYDLRRNYLGDRTAEDAIGPSNAVYQPFLTEPPSELEEGPEGTTEIAIDLQLEAGETYGVGVPGPSTTPISEMFEDDFEGAVYGFDAESQSWTMLTGDDTVDSLNAMVVVAETDSRLTIDFQSREDVPSAPGSYQLQEGWNFVTAPAYTDAEGAYGNYVGDGEPVISTFEAPNGQFGSEGELDGTYMLGSGDAPGLSPFEGYFVFSNEGGEQMPTRFTADPTTDGLYESLDVDDQFAGSGTEATSVEGLFERADETDGEVSEERLSDVVYGQFERALSHADDPRTALSSTVAEIVEEADGERMGLVENATDDALQQIVSDEFSGEPEEDAMKDVVREILGDEFSDESADESATDSEGHDTESTGTASESVAPSPALAA